MRGTLDVGFVPNQLLDATQNLFDGDAALPVLLLVQNAQTHRPGGVDVRVRQHRLELASKLDWFPYILAVLWGSHWGSPSSACMTPTPRRSTVSKEGAYVFGAGDLAVPLHHVQFAVAVLGGPGHESLG